MLSAMLRRATPYLLIVVGALLLVPLARLAWGHATSTVISVYAAGIYLWLPHIYAAVGALAICGGIVLLKKAKSNA